MRRRLLSFVFSVVFPTLGTFGLGLGLATTGCGGPEPNNPFVTTSSAMGGGSEGGGGSSVDPELGGPCVEDAQCDDAIDCTVDSCDKNFDRCRFHPEASPCQNGVYCDGQEVCDGKLGCVAGSPVDCGDDNLCSIDTCVEETTSCRHDPRDADNDGDPDGHCPPDGGDCNDLDPNVSSLNEEICGNGVDDNCNDDVDEDDCAMPENDTCLDALDISMTGTYPMSTFGASPDYPTSCGPAGAVRDIVAALIVPAGPPVDIVARARTDGTPVSSAIAEQCGDASSEVACNPSFSRGTGTGQVTRVRARSIGGGADDTAFPLVLTTQGASSIALDITYEDATTAPTNETCGTADELVLDDNFEIEIVDAVKDLETACFSATGDLVYHVTLDDVSDLEVWAVSEDGDGQVSLSLRDADCALEEDEIACHTALSAHLFRHSLPAGDYYLSVSATAPTTLDLLASVREATLPPADEDCSSGAVIEPNTTIDVSFDFHQDDHQLGCFQSATDAAYGLTIDEPSDVLLVQRISMLDAAGIELALEGCEPEDLLACGIGGKSPIRARRRNVAAGDYRVVAESLFGLPQQVTAFVRPYAPTTLVVFSDACADAQLIPETGGFFQGNTSNVTADFSAGCDSSGGPPNGAKDQLLKLVLSGDKRVIFDMSGSGYTTLLDVRKGPSCPGMELPLACTAAVANDKSYLDLMLEAGTYFVQVDGLGGATGPWTLDVHVVDP